MATAKTWIFIILGVLGACVLGLVVLAGAGVYFVSRHIQVRPTTSTAATQAIDEARAKFKNQPPLIELDEFEHPRARKPLSELPTSPTRPTDLHVLVWDQNEDKLVRVAVPFWLLGFARNKVRLTQNNIDVDRLKLDVPELERIGPALVLDFKSPAGERVLVWTQ